MDDHELNELLELGDGDMSLPPGVEDAILASVLDTYHRPVPVELPDEPNDTDLAIAAVRINPAWRRRDRLRHVVLAVATLVVILGGTLWAYRSQPAQKLETTGATDITEPSTPTPNPTLGPSAQATIDLCAAIDTGLSDVGLLGGLREAPLIDPDALATLVAQLRELEQRQLAEPLPDQPTLAALATSIDNLRLELERGTPDSATSAYAAARTETGDVAALLQSTCDG